ncbi:hypothetical protein SADUNF_Sadunf15G0063100 [Salix dunnii]|uniref:Uncharacterized protein n=1 Tax=Salix dunnii TaxID=1413687 RepID=A0A835MJ64_9ROSI|nr:hypothetical protein SADUNF_Sadunf15G0063100 [Salix dunnii]
MVSNVPMPTPGKDLVLFAIENCLLSVEAPPKDGLPHFECICPVSRSPSFGILRTALEELFALCFSPAGSSKPLWDVISYMVSNLPMPTPGKDLVLFAIENCLLSVEAPSKDGLPHVAISFQSLKLSGVPDYVLISLNSASTLLCYAYKNDTVFSWNFLLDTCVVSCRKTLQLMPSTLKTFLRKRSHIPGFWEGYFEYLMEHPSSKPFLLFLESIIPNSYQKHKLAFQASQRDSVNRFEVAASMAWFPQDVIDRVNENGTPREQDSSAAGQKKL